MSLYKMKYLFTKTDLKSRVTFWSMDPSKRIVIIIRNSKNPIFSSSFMSYSLNANSSKSDWNNFYDSFRLRKILNNLVSSGKALLHYITKLSPRHWLFSLRSLSEFFEKIFYFSFRKYEEFLQHFNLTFGEDLISP